MRPKNTRIDLLSRRNFLKDWGETPGVKVLVEEGFVDSFVAIVGLGAWFNVLGCSGTGGRKGVASAGC